jgi:two-component sensor histidine kinase
METAMVSREMNALIEADFKVREAHHRIKNSLQLVSSVLYLQATKHADPQVEAELFQASARIATIAKVHDRLCRTAHSEVDVASYLRELCADLASLSATPGQSIRVMAARMLVPADVAISLGLIVNELATNALKHAYRGGAAGSVQVILLPLDDGRLQLTVADKGLGLPAEAETAVNDGLGMRFVRNLCIKLQTDIEIDRSPPGTSVRLRLPPIEPSGPASVIYA